MTANKPIKKYKIFFNFLILLVLLLLFGGKKIRTLGSDLGAGLKGFKKSMKDDSEDDQQNNN